MKTIRRRDFLAAMLAPAPQPPFEEIAPERSGIRWRHDNAFSTEHYLPESLGPGVALNAPL